ncbi:hypothetical protein SAMN05421636_108229 [Pricia antarctica]|uniref:Uncharacterized protein n=1 Tax=Pricia antarctica TaxID=641691 RepID=A0A1G7GP68_9FLAO|nr:hypothetical protein [Pricia antarctica]SDE89930.1 hypothetical protein SAMN05421636_108229 [Pricia antarctica]
MGRNKFEKQLKEQLQKREIKPSKAAWDRISQQLEDSGKAKSIPFRWYGIAAGFIGILFVAVLYFTRDETTSIPETEITNSKMDAVPVTTNPEMNEVEKAKANPVVVESQVQEEKSIPNTSKGNANKRMEDALASSKAEETKMEKVVVRFNTSEALIETKIAEVVAQVEQLETENSTVTDAEIDSLLRGAQRQILKDKIFRSDKSVDAMALLADVENEIDRSFRDQIFDALKDGFLKIRTAVADRNQ